MTTRRIRVDLLARVEGEGALDLTIRNGQVTQAHLHIFEPPRLFEALLRGRGFAEAPDITARICGICPVAYQMSAVHAMEQALGITIGEPIRALRRLLYCGEWIESHALHMVMLHAPDFLGFPDGISMAREHGDIVRKGLAIKKSGNALLRALGGREIHPVNVRVGGFYRLPARGEFTAVAESLRQARDDAVALLRWCAGLAFPDIERPYEFVALRHAREYPLNAGQIVSSAGLAIDAAEYDSEFEEIHVAHSNALHAVLRRRGHYLVGPLARYSLNFDRLPPHLQALAREAGLGATCRNPFRSILVRGIELVWACEEALRIIADYRPEGPAAMPAEPRAGIGYAATEAPRGMLVHRYEIDAAGSILDARIVPPTSQNQPSIEDDLRAVAQDGIDLADDALRARCETTIRNHDPCISCATHFLRLNVDRA